MYVRSTAEMSVYNVFGEKQNNRGPQKQFSFLRCCFHVCFVSIEGEYTTARIAFYFTDDWLESLYAWSWKEVLFLVASYDYHPLLG